MKICKLFLWVLSALRMASKVDIEYLDLVQAAQPARRVQTLIESLAAYVDTASIPAGDGYSKVECPYDEREVLDKIKGGPRRKLPDLRRSASASFILIYANWVDEQQIADIVKSIVPPPKKKLLPLTRSTTASISNWMVQPGGVSRQG